MSGRDTSLSGELRDQEEIKALVVVRVFNQLRVDNGARLWVLGFMTAIFHEHSLVDSLVDHDESNLWRTQVVELLLKHGSQLLDLVVNDLLPHSVSNSIPEDDDLFRILTIQLFE